MTNVIQTVRVAVYPKSKKAKRSFVWLKVPAYSSPKKPLVITPTVAYGTNEIIPRKYKITHLRSGRALNLCSLTSLNKARAALRAILPLADWAKSFEELSPNKELEKKVQRFL